MSERPRQPGRRQTINTESYQYVDEKGNLHDVVSQRVSEAMNPGTPQAYMQYESRSVDRERRPSHSTSTNNDNRPKQGEREQRDRRPPQPGSRRPSDPRPQESRRRESYGQPTRETDAEPSSSRRERRPSGYSEQSTRDTDDAPSSHRRERRPSGYGDRPARESGNEPSSSRREKGRSSGYGDRPSGSRRMSSGSQSYERRPSSSYANEPEARRDSRRNSDHRASRSRRGSFVDRALDAIGTCADATIDRIVEEEGPKVLQKAVREMIFGPDSEQSN